MSETVPPTSPAAPASQKILVVDDEPDVTELLAFHLRAKGFVVETLNDPCLGPGFARTFRPDFVILDVMMPDLSGIQLCRLLRLDPWLGKVPVMFLTARTEEGDRIQGLETGADDYICKPFSTKEVVLRVQTILRRVGDAAIPPAGDAAAASRLLRAGDISLDTERHDVTIAGQPVDLTATEFKLLQLLMERRGRVQTREHLLINVWNYETEIETRTVDTHVRRLREKLGEHAGLIETIRGVGYRMAAR
ncbi:MAG: response regulator transcription factor [Opitutaceae bacterium]|jgi:two-component system phosphate regulon response regulator PhoB|nr:response regulator transcription factor [Opitutaceae bacterium]